MSKSIEEKFINDRDYRIYRLKHLAQKYGWALTGDDGETFRFLSKGYAILKINYWNLEIESSLSHPEWGNTVLLRKGEITHRIIESIFRNPRAHMNTEKVKSEYVNNSISPIN